MQGAPLLRGRCRHVQRLTNRLVTPRLTSSDKGRGDLHYVGRSGLLVRGHDSDAPTPSPFAGSGDSDGPLELHFRLRQSHKPTLGSPKTPGLKLDEVESLEGELLA